MVIHGDKSTMFGALRAGDVFSFEGVYHMKVNGEVESNCVCLTDGELASFGNGRFVTPVQGAFVVGHREEET